MAKGINRSFGEEAAIGQQLWDIKIEWWGWLATFAGFTPNSMEPGALLIDGN